MSYSLCGTSVENTGQQDCDKSKGVLRKLFIFNGYIDPQYFVDPATFNGYLASRSKVSKTTADKLFVLPEAQDLTLSNEANKEGSLNLGFKATILEGRPSYKVKGFAGADLLKRLRQFNNQNIRVIEYDANDTYWGTKVGVNFKGYQAKLFFDGGYIATGQNIEEGVVEFTVSILSTSEYKDNSYWMDGGGYSVENLVALLDINLTYISKSSNVYKIGLKIPGSNLIGTYNAYDEIGATVAALTFTAGSGATYGTSLPVTSVAVDATLKALTVTFDATAFGLLGSGAAFKLFPPTTSALDTASVTETELIPVILTK